MAHLFLSINSKWGFIKNPVLSITSSGEIGFSVHDIEASKMQGRARGRKGERKTYHINPYHHITMEFGGYLLNVAKTPTRARARKGEAQGVLSYQNATGIFDNPQMTKRNSAIEPQECRDFGITEHVFLCVVSTLDVFFVGEN